METGATLFLEGNFQRGQKPVVVDLEVSSVQLKFGFVSSSSYWGGGGLVCESVGKADMLSAHFDGKQSRDPLDLPSTCHLSPVSLPLPSGHGM